MERMFILNTNVKKVILLIILIIEFMTIKYTNISTIKYTDIYSKNSIITKIFNNIYKKTNTVPKKDNIENKDQIKKNENLNDKEINKNSDSNKINTKINEGSTKVNVENTESSNGNKDTSENNQENTSIKKQPSRGGNLMKEIDIVLTFYTSLPEENGGFKGINCIGQKLMPGMVANNVLPLGTKIQTREFGTLTVADRGGNNFNTVNRLDVYIPRNSGESDENYFKRVNDMGKVKVKGYLY